MEANFAREKLEGIMKESERKVIFITNSYHQKLVVSSKFSPYLCLS
jgi:long-subunit acyl-CoA synthetase (AMP-forming)